MQAVILAAGKGTRFGKLTEKTPKSLMLVAEKPILQYSLERLPSSIKEVFVVIGHLGNLIKNKFGDKFGEIKITYVELKELNGTAGALWAVKKQLRNKFLILNGDDIYDKKELELLIKDSWAIGLFKTTPPHLKYLTISLSKSNRITGYGYPGNINQEILLATGAYVLDGRIFNFKPVLIGDGKELGLPQTILKASKIVPTKGIIMKKWIQINYPDDIKKSEKLLK